MTTHLIKISDIRVPQARRRLDPAWVETLAQDIKEQGQLTPIDVVQEVTGFRLIFGGHRLAAQQLLGATEILAQIKQVADVANEAELRRREISENLVRRELSILDRAVDISDWRDIYDATHDTAKPGRRSAELSDELSAKFALNFSEAAQQTLNVSRRSVFNYLKVATVPQSVRYQISLHPIANSLTDLLLLAGETVERQAAIAAVLEANPALAGVEAAIAKLDQLPPRAKPAAWEKLSDGFSRLKENDQDRFFLLHEAAVRRWVAAQDEA